MVDSSSSVCANLSLFREAKSVGESESASITKPSLSLNLIAIRFFRWSSYQLTHKSVHHG